MGTRGMDDRVPMILPLSNEELAQLCFVLTGAEGGDLEPHPFVEDESWTINPDRSDLESPLVELILKRGSDEVRVELDVRDFEGCEWETWMNVSGRVFGMSTAMAEFATIHDVDEFVEYSKVKVRPGGVVEAA